VVDSSFVVLFAKKGDIKRALHWLGVMRNEGLKLDAVTFNPLISLSVQKGDVEGVRQVVRDKELKPNERTFNSLIDGLLKNGDIEVQSIGLPRCKMMR
jgi:Pentatricopeptide repeat domain